MGLKLYKGRPENQDGRLEKEIRVYNLLDELGLEMPTTTDELKTLIWRYFMSYWNNRRICSANGGLLPMIKRQQYYDSLREAA